MSRLFLLAFMALPLPLAAEPIFNLYDCTGREAQCTNLFPGQAAVPEGHWWDSPYNVGNRVVVNGIDLGPARIDYSPGPAFTALYYRDPWVIGWSYSTPEHDSDGHMVKWLLEGDSATMIAYDMVRGSSPYFADVNSSGLSISSWVRAWSFAFPTHYDGMLLGWDSIADEEQWRAIITDIEQAELFRINDAGQVLGSVDFWEGPPRLILLSPLDVPFVQHAPEPSTTILLGGLLLACVYRHLRR